jgi:hypothetical protein
MDIVTAADCAAEEWKYELVEKALWALGHQLPDADQTVFEEVMAMVNAHTGFFTAPASSKFHLNCDGGLLRHSVGVTYRLWALDKPYRLTPQYKLLDLFLAGLLHDLGKANQVTLTEDEQVANVIVGTKHLCASAVPYYAKEVMKTKPGEYKFSRNKDRVVMAVPVGSLHTICVLLSDIWKPSPDVWQAIAYHDGQYVPEGRHVAQSECKLALALHHADMYQCRYEGEWVKEVWSS